MKKTIMTAIFTAASALAFAGESTVSKTLSDLSLEMKAPRVDATVSKPGFTYLRMAVSDSDTIHSFEALPGLGLGYRLMNGNGAFDFSANYSSAKGWAEEQDSYFWTLPKASYIHYLTPAESQSAYAGVGFAWGELKTKDAREFSGVVSSATVGYEFFRDANVRTFTELTVSQPTIARTVSNQFPGPIAEFSLGAGF